MAIHFAKIASEELRYAVAWYNARNPYAAKKLLLRVQDAKNAIALFPFAAPPIGKRARRLVFHMTLSILPTGVKS